MTPTVGRIVHFYPNEADYTARSNGVKPGEPLAAIITRVWNEDGVNLTIFPDAAAPLSRTSVVRRGVAHENSSSWDWPPRSE